MMARMSVCPVYGCRTLTVSGRCTVHKQAENNRRALLNKELGRTSSHWRNLCAEVKERDGYHCTLCGEPGTPERKLTVDLIGGGDHATARPEQCRTLCIFCHGSVSATTQAQRRQTA